MQNLISKRKPIKKKTTRYSNNSVLVKKSDHLFNISLDLIEIMVKIANPKCKELPKMTLTRVSYVSTNKNYDAMMYRCLPE